ncbi:hypothetical protein SKAU_G00354880 [Synaphobranchus kaupii]|uniref:Uncharacterized protein n=1 Tax=Synaphobranchus kaupii TaxID=118154 RepID=A0A9Q1IGC5_SYNKA|nr:hypothetical protein SKAU_G00354880 [Synaphobranchus kaupii]
MTRTRAFRKSDQLFVSWAPACKGKAISKQRLSHWLVEAIVMAYGSKGVTPRSGLPNSVTSMMQLAFTPPVQMKPSWRFLRDVGTVSKNSSKCGNIPIITTWTHNVTPARICILMLDF